MWKKITLWVLYPRWTGSSIFEIYTYAQTYLHIGFIFGERNEILEQDDARRESALRDWFESTIWLMWSIKYVTCSVTSKSLDMVGKSGEGQDIQYSGDLTFIPLW